MAAKLFVVFCATALFGQTIKAQCIGSIAPAVEEIAFVGNAYGGPVIGAPLVNYASSAINPYGFVPSSGASSFAVTSVSPISPIGISIISENAMEGPINVIGDLPFLGAVAFESALPSAGAGAINYGCGSGVVGIASENIAPVAPGYGIAPAGIAPVASGYGMAPAGLATGRRGIAAAPGLGCRAAL